MKKQAVRRLGGFWPRSSGSDATKKPAGRRKTVGNRAERLRRPPDRLPPLGRPADLPRLIEEAGARAYPGKKAAAVNEADPGDETIREAGALARELGTVVHVHVAEDRADVDDARRRGLAGPLERLVSLEALPSGSILAHGVHVSADEVRRAAAAGCWFVHNPRSNEGNRVSYAAALSATKRVALGVDGWEPDMAAEEAALKRLAAENGDAGVEGRLAAGHDLIAERFGAANRPLSPGSLGDLVVRRDGAIAHVVVSGRVVVDNGVLATGDFERISAQARVEAARLWARMAEI